MYQRRHQKTPTLTSFDPWDIHRPMVHSPMSASHHFSQLQLNQLAAHHHLLTSGHHHPLSHPFLSGHTSLVGHRLEMSPNHFQSRHHPYLRVPPPSLSTNRCPSPLLSRSRGHESRGHESIDQYEFRNGTSEDGHDEDCDGDDSRSEMSSDISITDGPSHGNHNHRRSPQTSTNLGNNLGNGGNGNSPLDALFALTTKALDRVNNDKSAGKYTIPLSFLSFSEIVS